MIGGHDRHSGTIKHMDFANSIHEEQDEEQRATADGDGEVQSHITDDRAEEDDLGRVTF